MSILNILATYYIQGHSIGVYFDESSGKYKTTLFRYKFTTFPTYEEVIDMIQILKQLPKDTPEKKANPDLNKILVNF